MRIRVCSVIHLFDESCVRGVVLGARVEEDDVTVLDEDVTQPQPDEERI